MEKLFNNTLFRILLAVLLILAAVVSIFLVSIPASSTENHAHAIETIDRQTSTVLKLTATATLASAGISAIPGDTATPVAEKLADFTEYFLLILCVLYAEKYLVTIIGAGVFKILIPIACVLLIISLFSKEKGAKHIAKKLIIFSLALYFMIPLSINVSDRIYDVYSETIDETIDDAKELTETTSPLAETEDKTLIESILTSISETATSLADRAADTLNNFVESLAVMIVTSCVIPILVLLFFIWLVKMLTGNDAEEIASAILHVGRGPGRGRGNAQPGSDS